MARLKIALSLCDKTGNMLKPFVGRARCIAVDIQHEGTKIIDGIEYVGADVRSYLPPSGEYIFACGFTPCTHFAVSGARWFKTKGLTKLREGIEVAEACDRIITWTGAPGFIENPVGTLSTHWRKPDFTFDPCDYGDPYTKKTCLWAYGGFSMPPKKRVNPTLGSKMHLIPPSKDRADLRSETPMGFANAVGRMILEGRK